MKQPFQRSALVLGAGIQGACAALALNREGFAVTIVDQASEAMTRASLHNEGKIHLGFVYAHDQTDRTQDLMLHAALRFGPLIDKFIGRRLDWKSLQARPFTYLVLDDSMLAPDRIHEAYERLQERYADEIKEPGLHYLGSRPERLFQAASRARYKGLLNPDRVDAVVETAELSLFVKDFASLMRAALQAAGSIRERYRCRVSQIERTPSGFSVAGEGPDGRPWMQEAEIVVNCLWEGRLALDEQLGLLPRRPWVYRLKLRLHGDLPERLSTLPSLTMVLGPYGDIVTSPRRPAYLSWYPTGLMGWSDGVAPPPEWETACSGTRSKPDLHHAARGMLEGFESIIPGIRETHPLDLAGGVIFSWGESDIDDPQSELHSRHEIGVEAHDGYFTINTGKYTCAPLFAEHLVHAVQGAPSCP